VCVGVAGGGSKHGLTWGQSGIVCNGHVLTRGSVTESAQIFPSSRSIQIHCLKFTPSSRMYSLRLPSLYLRCILYITQALLLYTRYQPLLTIAPHSTAAFWVDSDLEPGHCKLLNPPMFTEVLSVLVNNTPFNLLGLSKTRGWTLLLASPWPTATIIGQQSLESG
jgi:hypothetical protein